MKHDRKNKSLESTRTPLNDATIVMQRQDLRVLSIKPGDPQVHAEQASPVAEGETIDLTSVKFKLGRSTVQPRFSESVKLGEGATGYVYAYHDRNCGRDVAIKVPKTSEAASYPEEVDRFLAEALVAAQLEHPNIIPVYDIDIDAHGKPFMAMRRVCGGTLKDHLTSPEKSSIENENDLVQVILKVCDALSFAHSKERIHQDIKPENIMIGTYGEVFVIDWGSSSYTGDEMAVTPVYMSPQQALGHEGNPSDDIYCLGATLFHCLIGRMPTNATSLEELFERKRKGIVDPLPPEEEVKASPPLLAIVMKSLACDPADRYATVKELAQDLKDYQSGKMVSAYQYSLLDLVKQWYRGHCQTIWFSLALIVLALAAGIGLYQLKLKEIATWGQPIVVETFDNESWRDRWVTEVGSAETREGQLYTTSDTFRLYYREKLYGSLALEFDGVLPPETAPGDLSITWCDDLKWKDGKIVGEVNRNYLQVGAYGNSFAMIETQAGRADYNSFRLKKGQVYRIRAEVDQNRLSLFVDGKLICESISAFPHTSGYIGLYGVYPGKVFDNVKIYRKGVAERIPATRVGDIYFRRKQYDDAASEYGEVVASHREKKIGQEAMYKAGLCRYLNKDREGAYAIWANLRDRRMLNFVDAWKIKELIDGNKCEEALAPIRQLATQGEDGFRLASLAWEKGAGKTDWLSRFEETAKYLKLHEEVFPHEKMHDFILGRYLQSLGRYEEVLEKYSHIEWMRVSSLYSLQRYEQILKEHPDMRQHCALSLIRLRRWDELETYTDCPSSIAQGLLWQRKYEEMIKRFPTQKKVHAHALVALGRYEEALDVHQDHGVHALKFLGRMDEATTRWPKESWVRRHAHLFFGRNGEEYYKDLKPDDVARLMIYGRGEFQAAHDLEGVSMRVQMLSLTYQGRYDEVLKHPTQRERIAHIRRLQGRPEEILRMYPNVSHVRAHALLMAGEYQQVIDQYWIYRNASFQSVSSLALLYLGKPGEVLRDRKGDHLGNVLANVDIAIRHHAQGNAERGRQVLRSMEQNRVGFYDWKLMLPFYIIRPLLLDPSNEQFRATLKSYAKNRRYVFAQRMWYLSRFMLGEIDDNGYRQQPFKPRLESRLLLAKALKASLNQKASLAQKYFKQYQALPRFKRLQNPVVDHFVDWQVEELKKPGRE